MAGIYLHIPFCKQACHYCDFHFSTSVKRKGEMLEALKKEIGWRSEELKDEVETIYFGGGTPSLLNPSEIDNLIETIDDYFTVLPNAEVTLEVNPDDLDGTRIREWAETSVNRLSVGIQSFRQEDLKFMNRAHDRNQALSSLKTACDLFENISIDLIYGVPGLSSTDWRENLETAFGFPIQHISSYALTVEPKTALEHFIRSGKCPAPDENEARQHFEILMEECDKRGFEHYEVSNFAKPGYVSRHNTSYWQGKPYLGIGPSAHSYSGQTRSWNVSNNARYLKGIEKDLPDREIENLTERDIFNETVMTGLRTSQGLSQREIQDRFGEAASSELMAKAERFIKEGLLRQDSGRIRATESGIFLIDGIAADLFMD